ncbi:hypothetical protein KIN20_000770 [Parelaphostrongylus tenuis]|uniref:F-box domain-containing protein n=1 Tax=Parelaphostrongylus tenuis TaxID=148309 RepID=A0AAD5LWR2_PARTN|nr:hypothetical protein KIN20_000770 [Parelaphostrongylus tenuis]
MPQRLPIIRCCSSEENGDDRLPMLPDEIIANIVSKISPTEIVTQGWIGVSTGFDSVVEEHLKRSTTLDVCEDFIWKFLRAELLRGFPLSSSHKRLLELLMKRCFTHLRSLTTPIALFSQVHFILEEKEPDHSDQVMPHLKNLTVQIGEQWGPLLISHNYDNLKICRKLCGRLAEVNLHVKVSDSEIVTCCGFRSLVLYLLEVTTPQTIWNLTLEDCTTGGQGYHGPTDLSRSRNKTFICYVRTLLDLNVSINRLTLLDRRKVSPYMMVMSLQKRRSIYMYPEFKRCRELFVCYDIGLIAPLFAHQNDKFTSLRIFEVDESHVFYKRDLLEYLSNAPNLCELRVVVPATWFRRVSRCKRGCFTNPDFACFRPDGWCTVQKKLPTTRFALIGWNDKLSESNESVCVPYGSGVLAA